MPRRHCRDATVCIACALLWCALVLRFKDRTMLTGEGALPFCGADGDPRWTPLACVDGVLTSSPTEPGAISQCDLASGSKPCVPAKMWVQASCRLPPALAPRDLEYAACPYVKKPHYLCPKAQRDELARSVQVRWHGGCDGGVPRLDAFLHDGSFARAFAGRAVCLVGDSAMNQFWHALECRLHAANLVARREVLQTWGAYSFGDGKEPVDTRVRLTTTFNASFTFTFTASDDMWRKGTMNAPDGEYARPLCAADVVRRRPFARFCPAATDEVVVSLAPLHCARSDGAPEAGSNFSRRVLGLDRVRRALRRELGGRVRRATLLGSTLPRVEMPAVLRRVLEGPRMKFERRRAKELGFEYLDAYRLTRELDEASPARTDLLHYCQPGVPEVLADLWVNVALRARASTVRPS